MPPPETLCAAAARESIPLRKAIAAADQRRGPASRRTDAAGFTIASDGARRGRSAEFMRRSSDTWRRCTGDDACRDPHRFTPIQARSTHLHGLRRAGNAVTLRCRRPSCTKSFCLGASAAQSRRRRIRRAGPVSRRSGSPHQADQADHGGAAKTDFRNRGHVEVDATIGLVAFAAPAAWNSRRPAARRRRRDRHHGKRAGAAPVRFFREMDVALKARARMETDLRAASPRRNQALLSTDRCAAGARRVACAGASAQPWTPTRRRSSADETASEAA